MRCYNYFIKDAIDKGGGLRARADDYLTSLLCPS